MKYIVIKIYEIKKEYRIKISFVRITENHRIFDKIMIKKFDSLDNIKQYFNSFDVMREYRSARVLVDYISPRILLENINFNNEKIKSNKNNIQDKIEELYPNFQLTYDLDIENYMMNGRQKYYLVTMISKEMKNFVNNNFSIFSKKKVYLNFDQTLNNFYLSKLKYSIGKQHILYIIIECEIYRILEIVNCKMINLIYLDAEDPSFEDCRKIVFNRIDKRFDAIVIDSDFKTYMNLAEELEGYNVIYYEYSDKMKFFDERKLIYATK